MAKPVSAYTRATIMILSADDAGYDVTAYHVAYDTEAVIQQMHAIGFPDIAYMEPFYRGDYISEHLK